MKLVYISLIVSLLGACRIAVAQKTDLMQKSVSAKDSSGISSTSARQLNLVLPANGGAYIDATSTVLPYLGYSISGVPKAYTMYNGNSNQYEYHQSSDITPDFLISGSSKAVFNTGFLGVGTSTPTTAFTGLSLKSPANSWYGMYVDAGATGQPFYGYALNGIAAAYTQFNGSNGQFEYFQSNPSTPDFIIKGNNKAVFNTAFLGVGTSTPTTAFTGLSLKSSANSWYGMYVDAGATGQPFYGYALNGIAAAYTQYNGTNGQYEYFQSSPTIPDFFIKGSNKAVFNTAFLGIGTSTPTTAFTGLSLKSPANSWFGMYVDAGATGQPFYGYALDGIAAAYTQYNGTNGQYEYFQSSPTIPDFFIKGSNKAVFNTAFLGIGTSTPTTAFTGLSLKSPANSWFGMYVDAGATGQPFYGYALDGVAAAYTQYNGTNGQYEYFQSNPTTPDFFIKGNAKAVFNTAFVGIGTSSPTTAATGFSLKSSANSWYGMYVDAGTTGLPFYGYALNGVAKAFTQFNGTSNQFEYYQSSDITPDFYVKGNSKVVFNTAFMGIGTSSPTTGADAFTLKSSFNGYYGMYVDAGATGLPFYGYALNGIAKAWTDLNGATNNWELNYNGAQIVVTSTGNVGLGTSSPAQKLDVNGTIHALNLNGGATSLSTDAAGNIIRTPSDARLKCGITDIDQPLEKVLKLRGVTYNFIDAQRFGTDRQMGFLAQDLEKVVPETVSSGGEYKSVNYQEITALLTEAIKAQQKIITELKNRIEVLESNQK